MRSVSVLSLKLVKNLVNKLKFERDALYPLFIACEKPFEILYLQITKQKKWFYKITLNFNRALRSDQ